MYILLTHWILISSFASNFLSRFFLFGIKSTRCILNHQHQIFYPASCIACSCFVSWTDSLISSLGGHSLRSLLTLCIWGKYLKEANSFFLFQSIEYFLLAFYYILLWNFWIVWFFLEKEYTEVLAWEKRRKMTNLSRILTELQNYLVY